MSQIRHYEPTYKKVEYPIGLTGKLIGRGGIYAQSICKKFHISYHVQKSQYDYVTVNFTGKDINVEKAIKHVNSDVEKWQAEYFSKKNVSDKPFVHTDDSFPSLPNQEIKQKLPQDTQQEIKQKLPQETQQEIKQEIPQDIQQEIKQEIPQETQQNKIKKKQYVVKNRRDTTMYTSHIVVIENIMECIDHYQMRKLMEQTGAVRSICLMKNASKDGCEYKSVCYVEFTSIEIAEQCVEILDGNYITPSGMSMSTPVVAHMYHQ